jgi:hypothetical protein
VRHYAHVSLAVNPISKNLQRPFMMIQRNLRHAGQIALFEKLVC